MKYKPNSNDWVMANMRTGEVAEWDLTLRKKWGGSFMKVWQDKKWESVFVDLQGNTLRLLHYLTNMSSYQNVVPTPKETALKIGWKSPNVYRAYNELLKSKLMYKWDGIYSLSPFYCWKGTDQQLKEARKELTERTQPSIGTEE